MHISEGILSIPILAGGAAITVAALAYSLKRLDSNLLPQTAIMAAGFFVATLIHVPIPPAQAHLLLVGLMGLVLGWAAFPAIFVALLLQALLFQYGGFTTLGINTFNLAFPAVLCGLLLRPLLRKGHALCAAILAGLGGVLLSGLLVAFSLFLSGDNFFNLALLLFAAHIPIIVLEALITPLVVCFLIKVRPQVFRFAVH